MCTTCAFVSFKKNSNHLAIAQSRWHQCYNQLLPAIEKKLKSYHLYVQLIFQISSLELLYTELLFEALPSGLLRSDSALQIKLMQLLQIIYTRNEIDRANLNYCARSADTRSRSAERAHEWLRGQCLKGLVSTHGHRKLTDQLERAIVNRDGKSRFYSRGRF